MLLGIVFRNHFLCRDSGFDTTHICFRDYGRLSRSFVMVLQFVLCACAPIVAEDASTAARQGDRLSSQRRYKAAIVSYSRSLELAPDEDVFVKRSNAYSSLGDFRAAIDDLTSALESKHNYAPLLAERARCRLEMKDLDAALNDCNRAIASDRYNQTALETRLRVLYRRGSYASALEDGKALALFSDNPHAALITMGHIYRMQGDWISAIMAYDRAVLFNRGDREGLYFAMLAMLDGGDNKGAISRCSDLILYNPEQGGGYARLWPYRRVVTADELTRGERQIKALCHDIPALSYYTRPEDDIYIFLVRKFAGEDIVGGVLWDARVCASDAEHDPPYRNRSARIRLRHGSAEAATSKEEEFEKYLSLLVFELHNLQSHRRYHELATLARSGDISKMGFIREVMRLEFEALRRVRAWCLDMYVPFASKKGMRVRPNLWNMELELEFDEFIARFSNEDDYPWSYFGDYYDEVKSQGP